MITKYYNRQRREIVITEMHSWHLISAYNYFNRKLIELAEEQADDNKLLRVMLLVSALRNEIDRRGLFDY